MATMLVWLVWAVWHLPVDFSRPGGWSLPAILQLRGPTLLVVPFVLPAAPALRPLIFVWAVAVVIADRMWRRVYRPLAA